MEKPNRCGSKLIFQIHLVNHQIIVAPSMTRLCSLWAIRAYVSFPCPVVILFWLLGTPSQGGLHTPPEAAWIHIGTMLLGEWMDGQQHNWNSVNAWMLS